MNIFYKRPLSLILCVMLGGFVVCANFGQTARAVTAALSLILLAVFILTWILLKKRKLIIALTSLALLLSALFSYFYFERTFAPEELYGKAVKISGTVIEIDESSNHKTTLVVRTYEIDGKEAERKILVRISKEDGMYAFLGANTEFFGSVEPIESTDEFDSKSYYYSQGVCARVNKYENISFTKLETTSLSLHLERLRDDICRYSILVMGDDAGSLFSAVFMGNKSYLSSELKLDFTRIGITHILALSGMHLAILAIGVTKLLSLIGVKKKPRTVILMLITASYMALTGFSVSVVRAGLMVLISSLLYLFASMRDSQTNLCLSVFIITLFDPVAIFDASLWLSAFATLGIVVMSELFSRKINVKSLFSRFLLWILLSFLSSFFAISATMAITTAISDKMSVLSALSTLIFSLFIEILIYVGLVILLLGSIFPIGELIMQPLTNLIEVVSSAFSSPSWVLVYVGATYTKIAILIFSILFFSFLIFKLKHKRIALCTLACSFLFVHSVAAYDTYGTLFREDIIYTENTKHDIITLKSEGKSCVVDVCSYSESTGYDTLDALLDSKTYTVDKYVVSHYSYGLSAALDVAFSKIKTKLLLIPAPKNDKEKSISNIITASLEHHGTEIQQYDVDENIEIGSYTFVQRYRVEYGDGTAKCAFEISGKNTHIAYLSSGMLHYKTRDLAYEILFRSDKVIFGEHGETYEPIYYLKQHFPSLKLIVIGGERIYLTQTSIKQYKENGTKVLSHPNTVSLIY